ncbi:MAG TPA: PLDc N-terminal domain-containing protein [Chitinophagaceae bacterium]
MNTSRLLLIAFTGLAIAIAGFFLHLYNLFLSSIFLGVGGLILLVFYIMTWMHVIKGTYITPKQKIFWIVVLACLPVIGNLLYVVIVSSINSKQKKEESQF